MFKIRDEHVGAFRLASRAEFERRVVARLRADWPEPTESMTDEDFFARLREWEPTARGYGFRTEREIAHYAEASLLLGGGFEHAPQHDWAQSVIHSTRLNSAEKAKLLAWTAGHIYRDRQSVVEVETNEGRMPIKIMELP